MSDIASEFADYLAEAGFGTVGQNIFIGAIRPDSEGLFIERIGGVLNNYVPMEQTTLDLYAYFESAETAITTLENIKRHIHRMHTVDRTGAFIYTILLLGDIEDVSRDMEYRKIVKVTLQIHHRDTALIS